MNHQEPDPASEYFDVVDTHGQPTGERKARSMVHRDGDWHRSFHLWVVTEIGNGVPGVIFQRRSHRKDTNPGRLDVAVGGHYRSGEGFAEVVREIEEELGLAPPVDRLVSLGRRWSRDERAKWVDREIQDVYGYCLDAAVSTLRPSFEEIAALDLIACTDVEALFTGGAVAISSVRHRIAEGNRLLPAEPGSVTVEDFIPVPDKYWLAGSRAAREVLCREPNPQLLLG